MAILERATKMLNGIYPFILILTGLAIFVVGICSIVVLTKFGSFSPTWVYHLAVISIFITMVWWLFYFIYKGLKLFDRQGIKKDVKNV